MNRREFVKAGFCAAVALAWTGHAADGRPFTVHPLPIGTSASTEEIVTTVRGVHRCSGISRFVLHAPGHGVRLTGYYDAEGYRGVGRRIRAVQDQVRAEGIDVGFLMGPTMNVGVNHPWRKFTFADGRERAFTACAGDRAFQRDFARTLAGGRDRPLVRWYGTVYGYDRPLCVSDMLFSALWAKENVSDGFDCVYEADAAPNTAFYGSGARLGASCSSVLAAGFDGLWYWAAACGSFGSDDPKPNLEGYARSAGRWAVLQAAVKGGRTVGVSVAFNPRVRLVAEAWRGAAVEILDGSAWRPAVGATWTGGRLRVPARLGVFDALVIRLNQPHKGGV